MSEPVTPEQVWAALAEVCGYHEEPNCGHCCDAYRWKVERRGWTLDQLYADIIEFRDNYESWLERRIAEVAGRG